MSFPKPYADTVARLRVALGFLLAGVFLWFSDPRPYSLAVGLPVAVVGLFLRAWAAGHLEKNLELAQDGPYARVRNPLYAGTLTAAAGLAIAARSWILAAVLAAFFLCVYLPVVELEEQHLARLFPEFQDYARRVRRLIPRLGGVHGAGKRFRWALYVRNREYQALAGFVAGTAVLTWKVLRL
jgi:protein-S-isoprenylcysteine O-methyltransferase Ste14